MKDDSLPFGNAASSPPAPSFAAVEEKFELFELGEEEIESDAAPVPVAAKKVSLADIPIPEPELIKFPVSLREALGNATNGQIAEAYRRLNRFLKVVVGHRFGFIVVNSLSSILLDFMPPGIASATDFESRKLDDALRDMRRFIRDMIFSQQDDEAANAGRPVIPGHDNGAKSGDRPTDNVLEAGLNRLETPEREECPVVARDEDILSDVLADREQEQAVEFVECPPVAVIPPDASPAPPPVEKKKVLALEPEDEEDEEPLEIPWINRVIGLDLESLDKIEAVLSGVPFALLSGVLGESAFFYQTYRAIALLLKQPPVRGVSFNKLQARIFLTMLAEEPFEPRAAAEKFSGENVAAVYSARHTALEKMKKIGQAALKVGVKTEDYIRGLLDQKADGYPKSLKQPAVKKPVEERRKYNHRRPAQEEILGSLTAAETVVPAVSSDVPDIEAREATVNGKSIAMPAGMAWPDDLRARLEPHGGACPENLWLAFAEFTNLEQKALSFEFALNYPPVSEADMESFVRDEAGFGEVIARLIGEMKARLGNLAGGQEKKCPVSPVFLPAQKPVLFENGRKLGVRCRFSDFTPSEQFRQIVISGIIPPVSEKELEKAFYEAPISDFQRSAVVCVYNVARPAVTRRDLDKIKGKKKKSAEEIAKRACREMRAFIAEFRAAKTRQVEELSFPLRGKRGGLPPVEDVLEFLKKPAKAPVVDESHEINTVPAFDLTPGAAREKGAPEIFGAEKQKQSWIDQVREARRFNDFRDPAGIQLYLSQLDFGRIKKALGNLGVLTDAGQLMPLFQYPPEIAHPFSPAEQTVFLLSFGKAELKPAEIAREIGKKICSVYVARFSALKKVKEFLADPEAAARKTAQERGEKTPAAKSLPKHICQPRHAIKDQNETRQAAWLNQVFSIDLQNEQAVRALLREASFDRLRVLTGFSGNEFLSAEDFFPAFLQPADRQGFLTPYQAGICLACVGPVAVKPGKIAALTSAVNTEIVTRAKFSAKYKLNRLANFMSRGGLDLRRALESFGRGGRRRGLLQPMVVKPASARPGKQEMLDLAYAVWTDRLLASLEIYLGELSGLLVHPAQLAPVFRFNNLGISRDVFLLFFDKSGPKDVVEIAKILGRTKESVSAAKGRVLYRLGEKLRKTLSESRQEEVYSVALTGFDVAGYVALLQKQAESRLDESKSKPRTPAGRGMAKWLATFSDEGLKRLVSAAVVELGNRKLTGWFLEEMGLSAVDEVGVIPSKQEIHAFGPSLAQAPEADHLWRQKPRSLPAAVAPPVNIPAMVERLAKRLSESSAFREELVVLITRETLLKQLAYLYDKQRNEFDALRLYFSSAGGSTRTYKEVTDLLWEKGYGGSSAIGRDWVKLGLKRIRNRASGMEG